MGGVAKMPAGLSWLLIGVVLAFGVAASPAQASRRANHYDFFVSPSIYYYVNILSFSKGARSISSELMSFNSEVHEFIT